MQRHFNPMDASSVVVLRATDDDFECFHSFITAKEQQGVGRADGVFKIIIDPDCKAQSVSKILDLVKGDKSKVFRQKLLKGNPDDIFTYKRCTVGKADQAAFCKQALCLSSYRKETCCSEKLRSEGLDGVLQHFFQDIVLSQCERSSDNNLHSRQQRLLREGTLFRKKFEQNDNFFGQRKRGVVQCSCPECDQDSCLDESEDEEVSADPARQCSNYYGTGITLKKTTEPIFITEKLSLSRLRNILNIIKQHFDGLLSPNVYVGTKHSFFPVHIEDASLWSINFLHFGHIKLWIVIPPHALLLLMFHLCKSGVSLGNTSCWNSLGHKTIFLTPKWLKERQIPYKVVVQHPGEAVILYPNAAHFGFNLGWNFAEGINFGTVAWIPEGINSPKCQCIPDQIHLDLSLLIAAFMPEHLNTYLTRGFIPTESMYQMALLLQKSLKVLPSSPNFLLTADTVVSKVHKRDTAGGECYPPKGTKPQILVECPILVCDKKYPLGKKPALIRHVLRRHKPLVEKCNLLSQIDKKYLEAKQLKKMK